MLNSWCYCIKFLYISIKLGLGNYGGSLMKFKFQTSRHYHLHASLRTSLRSPPISTLSANTDWCKLKVLAPPSIYKHKGAKYRVSCTLGILDQINKYRIPKVYKLLLLLPSSALATFSRQSVSRKRWLNINFNFRARYFLVFELNLIKIVLNFYRLFMCIL